MFETLKRLYIIGELSNSQLNKAVQKGWITETQKNKLFHFHDFLNKDFYVFSV